MATKEELRLRARRFSRNVLSSIRDWWDGEFVPFYNSGDDIFIMGGVTHRHWTANLARSAARFIKHKWDTLLFIAIGVAGVLVAM